MKTFKDLFTEDISKIDMIKLNMIVSYLQNASTEIKGGKPIKNKKDIEKINNCLKGMSGCAAKINEIITSAI